MQLVEDAFPQDPALDLAISTALLQRVARRDAPATARLYRPAPTVAFGRLDALRDGYQAARHEALARGFMPVLRTVGGHAAAYTDRALVYEEITPQDGLAVDVEARFRAFSEALADALRALGADARVGEVPGEYCPGRFTVNAGGTLKLAGVAQRVISGASLVSGVVVAGDGARVRDVLTAVYAKLELDWDPATAGALADVVPGLELGALRDALAAGRPAAELDDATLSAARAPGRAPVRPAPPRRGAGRTARPRRA